MGPILPIAPIGIPQVTPGFAGTNSTGAFQEAFTSAIRNVDALQQEAAGSVERFLSGDQEDLHNSVLSTTRAELAFDLFLQTRNKVIGAYQEIMKMQL